ncbi:hypothetical protein NE850_23090 [Paraburkholderia sp. USG1]|uniref:transglycosylase SLT domain-containing protein n=1 Tax=Paraburkholderia sp. USG1 TaxID=2952268 RepID=UPI0028629D6C|nr:transglycosylase SLT domain-containing protein [Paraburkholderia sp. USG1]MDR8399211.1 hypothetical protein [Paraburkholderia sp. USG1]
MAGEGNGKKILEIPIDSSQWDAFVTSFHNWQGELEKQNGAWAGTNRGIKEVKTAFDDVESTFSALVDKSINPKFIKSFGVVEKTSKETAKSWQNIARDIEKTTRGVNAIARGNLGALVSGAGGVAGLLAALAAGAYGVTRETAADVAQQNRSAGGLGLEIGQEQAFELYGKNSGLDRDTLEKIENAKGDVTLQTPFINAGISQYQMQNEAAPDLAFDVAKAMGQQFAQWQKTSPAFALNQAQAYGYTDVFSPDELRLLAKRTADGSLDKEHAQYGQNWQKMGLDQQAADHLSDFDEHQRANWKEISTAWDKDVEKLTPALDRWSTAATNLVTSFLDKATDTVADLDTAGQNPFPPGTEPPPAKPDDYGARITRGAAIAGQWLQAHGFNNPFNGTGTQGGQQGFTADPDKDTHMAALEKLAGMPKGFLMAEENIESSGGRNNINPNNPNVLGAFQFDEATAKRYGVDRHDEYSSTVGAARYLADLKKKYGSWDKAAAAYDGFGGLDADIKKYGDDWKKHISEFQKSGETEMYLRKLAWQGIDLNSSQPATPFNDSKAMKAAKDADRLNTDPQIVPFDSVDQHAADTQPQTHAQGNQDYVSGSLTDRLTRAAGVVSGWFDEGGGAALRTPDSPTKTTPGTQHGPFNISVTVTSPTGSDVQVTGASLAQ